VEETPTRDHTERALEALGAPVRTLDGAIAARAFQHGGFQGSVPGDVSSAAFLVAAAALTRSELRIERVGLNPSRTAFLHVMRRMGLSVQARVESEQLGEPVGELHVTPGGELSGSEVPREEIPLMLDEVPILALVAVHASGESRFSGAGELRVKESDRLHGLAEGIRALGGHARVEGEDLVVEGGGLAGGLVRAKGDHRMAMAFAVAGLASRGPVEVNGIEAADVSFPGFVSALRHLGARVEG
jgi:3-phosphoshikimate 1-carboxyvinyltransferase